MGGIIQDPRTVFKGSQWIWIQPQGYDLVNVFMQARCAFSLGKVPRRARVRITADSRYKLFVNGRYLCRGPARGFAEHWPYDEVDIGPYLRGGRNVVAALVLSYGHGTNQYLPVDAAGLIVRGRAGRNDISTGGNWRVRQAPGYKRHLTRLSRELGFEEIFDADLDDGSWVLPRYNDGDWGKPVLTAAGAMPWHYVEPRGIPMMDERIVTPAAAVARTAGKCARSWRKAENLTALYLSERKAWKAGGPRLRRTASVGAFTVQASAKGGFQAVLVDFGEEVVGSVGIEVTGAQGGEAVDWQAAETLTALAPDVASPFVGCNVALCNRLLLRKGENRHEQFEPWGFRYLALVFRENRKPLKVRLWLRTALYPLKVKADFRSDDRALEAIYEISERAQKCCMLDAYVDCPWREQAQWWGDARVQAANTFHLSADTRLFERGIRQTAGQEVPNGLTYGLTPANMHHCILPDYTLTWVMTLRDHYWQTGSRDLIREFAERAWRALSYFEEMTAPNGLLPYDDRYWLFLDWADIFKDGYPTLYNLMYFEALVTASRLFGLVGRRQCAARCKGRAARLRKAITSRLFDASRGVLHGGLDWKGRPVKSETPHAYAFAILSDLLPDFSARFARDKLLPLVLGPNPRITGDGRGLPFDPAATPSSFFMHYVFEALKQTGHAAEVVDCIRRWWGVFLDWGFTTTGEEWHHEKGMTSACHAWSAHPIVHFHNIVLGVTQSAVGWRRVRFAPVFAGCNEASGEVATPLGIIRTSWRIKDGAADVRLSLPGGTSARVSLPGTRGTVKSGRHRWKVTLGKRGR
ncbi:MAG: alpha-L-rhamnosidase-related protein [Planctomycetota bacterium]|jgi:hypothetical protein